MEHYIKSECSKVKPSSEEVVNEKTDVSSEKVYEHNEVSYDVAEDTVSPIGGGVSGGEVYYLCDKMSKIFHMCWMFIVWLHL